MFRGTPLTLQVAGADGRDVRISLDGVETLRLSPTDSGKNEVSLVLEKEARLEISAEQNQGWEFQVVRPAGLHDFIERDGFLYVGDTPVILMPDHKLPPELDRRWETLGRVSDVLQPNKQSITSIHAYLPRGSSLLEDLPLLWVEDSPPVSHPPEDSWFQMHGLLTGFEISPADFVLFEVDFYDLERGMSPVAWLMKWQFVLQHIQAGTGYEDGLLMGPAGDASLVRWTKILEPSLISLARAHGLRYVDRSLPTDVWQERIVHGLEALDAGGAFRRFSWDRPG
ncbi:MAG: hypothetical protein PF795_13640, partial [Kiritimatiellae bacterium]|nr:hypothetical protein [Kiritimatiellia bacterium]